MEQRTICKTLAVAVILLLSTSVTLSFGISNNDDTTPPVTFHTLNPKKPDGENGWYVSDVNVTLSATDDMSGVKEIRYTINNGPEQVIIGDFGNFILHEDSLETRIEYWAIDNAGNIEHWNAFIVHIDQTEPDIIDFYYEVTGGSPERGWEFTFTMVATDDMSGMERVEFYFNDELQYTEEGPGPTYTWTVLYRPSDYNSFHVNGLISNLEITEEYIAFFAIIVLITKWQENIYPCAYVYDKAGNYDWDGFYYSPHIIITPGIYLFESLKLPNDYDGYIGRFLISAEFNNY